MTQAAVEAKCVCVCMCSVWPTSLLPAVEAKCVCIMCVYVQCVAYKFTTYPTRVDVYTRGIMKWVSVLMCCDGGCVVNGVCQ